MDVKVKLFASFGEQVGKNQLTVSATDVRDLLNKLTAQYEGLKRSFYTDPQAEKLGDNINIMVNGRNINFTGGLDTPLKDGDRVAIFPPVAGGLRKIYQGMDQNKESFRRKTT